MSKQFIAILALIVIVFIGIFAYSNHKSNNKSNPSALSQHIEGQGKAGVTLVEYGDYQCPFCGEYYATVKQVAAEFNDQIKFQFRNFPLVNIHQNAFAGARAAEAAAMQNQFWQMHDLLYVQNQAYYNSNQQAATWINSSDPLSVFDQYARQLGLNVTRFNSDYSSTQVNDVINADEDEGNKLGVNATPTFFLDGKKIQPTNTVSSFESAIKAEITQKSSGQSH